MSSDSVTRADKIVPIDAQQAELVARVAALTSSDGLQRTAFAPLSAYRATEIGLPLPSVYTPCLCVVVQGRKRAILGNESFYYDPFNYLLVSLSLLPARGQILEASPDRPYLCLRFDIDVGEMSRLLLEMQEGERSVAPGDRPLYVARMSPDLLEAVLRLVRLLDAPVDLPVLGPLMLREIWYRLLCGEMGQRLRALIETAGAVQRISRAIEQLQRRFDQPLRIDELASVSHMSPSTFHARFKAVTSLSPLQFQKNLRLHEARRLMLSEGVEAAVASYRVGYESPSQFSREYRRLFGAPPRREIASFRSGSTVPRTETA
jgi:AraC-like DNA-binding protein